MQSCFLYARKSTEDEDRQVLSIESQINEMQQVAEKLNIEIKEILIESKSAKEPGRPIFNKMMSRLSKKEADGILCWKLDRLARNPIDGASIIWAMKQNGIKIFTPSQTYSHADDNTILLYIEFGMAQKYIDDLSKNVKRGTKMKLEKGGWPAPAPIGYLNDKVNRRITKDAERFDMIRKMWDLMLTGNYSIQKILEIANNDWGFRTRKMKRLGNKPLTKSMLYRIFTNPFYYGYMRHKQGLYKGKHEAMVTEGEFEHVQELLGRTNKPKFQKHYFPFGSGLMKCGECGCAITAEQKLNRYGYHYIYYHCTKKKLDIKCQQKYVQDKLIENQIVNFLDKLSIPESLEQWLLNNIKYVDEDNQLAQENSKKNHEKNLNDLNKQVEELNRMRYRGFLDDDEFLKEKAHLLQQKQISENKLVGLKTEAENILPLLSRTLQFSQNVSRWYKKANPDEKRLIIETIGSNLILKDKILLIQTQIPFKLVHEMQNPNISNISRSAPANLGQYQLNNPTFESTFPTLRGRWNDVRNFFLGNFAWTEKFEQLYARFCE